MEVQSSYVLSALDCIRVGLLHYELRDRMISRAPAAVQLSTATEHLLREKLRLLDHPRHDGWIIYSELAETLTPGYVRWHEARALKSYRKLRNRAVHNATQIERKDLAGFERSTSEILGFIERFVREELQIDLVGELESPFVQMLRCEALDFHDKADLRSRAAIDLATVEQDIEDSIELANEAFDLAIRAVACGVGLPADRGTTDEVLRIMQEQGRDNEAWCSIHDEYVNLEPGDFQKDYASFSDIMEVEEYVRLLREVVVDLLSRARRPVWQRRIRDSWPHVMALVEARSPATAAMFPEDPQDVSVTGTRVGVASFVGPADPEAHRQLLMAALRHEIQDLPREFKLALPPRIMRRTIILSDGDDS